MTRSIRATLLATLLSGKRTLLLSGSASAFLAMVAALRTHAVWAVVWLIVDMALVAARWRLIEAYERRDMTKASEPYVWATRYAPLAMGACLLLGVGTMLCILSLDNPLATLAIMVTAGMLGGIASRNSILPRLAMVMILLGVVPIGIGSALAPGGYYWILIPPLIIYSLTMATLVQSHYNSLLALMTAEQSNAALAARFDAALRYLPHGLCAVDEQGRVTVANDKIADLFGDKVRNLPLNVSLPEFIGNASAAAFGEAFRLQVVERCTAWLGLDGRSLDLSLNNGSHLQLTRNLVPDGSAVVIIEDVSERRSVERELRHRAHHDLLTGLPNRRYFDEYMLTALQDRAERQGEGHSECDTSGVLAVMYLDLDGFKTINDRHGHLAGDEVLKTVVARVQAVLPSQALFTRIGGDEFAVTLRPEEPGDIAVLAGRLIAVVAEPIGLNSGPHVTLSLSIGIANARPTETAMALMGRADIALYAAKAAGKSVYRFAQD